MDTSGDGAGGGGAAAGDGDTAMTELTEQLDSAPPLTPRTGDGAGAGGGSSLTWAERAAAGQQEVAALQTGVSPARTADEMAVAVLPEAVKEVLMSWVERRAATQPKERVVTMGELTAALGELTAADKCFAVEWMNKFGRYRGDGCFVLNRATADSFCIVQ
jgi:hypothetical protein